MSPREGAVSVVDKSGRPILRTWLVAVLVRRAGRQVLGVARVDATTDRAAVGLVSIGEPGAVVFDVRAA